MITFNIITLFPNLFEPFLQHLPISRAIEKKLIQVNLIQLRDFAIDERGTVDDRPYGGGVGMLLRIEPVYEALESLHKPIGEAHRDRKVEILATAPSGERFTQKKAEELSGKKEITIICGRYEGMDERIKTHLATQVISVGDYVLSGGELPALTIMEAVTRLISGVLEKEEAVQKESFSRDTENPEYPQYTRPEEYKNLKVPEILLSGNHEEIEKWRSSINGKNTKE